MNAWSYTSTPPIRLHGVVISEKKHMDKFTFTFRVFKIQITYRTVGSTLKHIHCHHSMKHRKVDTGRPGMEGNCEYLLDRQSHLDEE
jgi:hypothetical protein